LCHQALITCLGRLRTAIVAYAELASTMEPGSDRDQVLVYAEEIARQNKTLEAMCNLRCGSSRCTDKGDSDA